MRGKGQVPLGKKKGYYIKVNPEVIKAVDEIGESIELDRNATIELALSKFFVEAIDAYSEYLPEVKING